MQPLAHLSPEAVQAGLAELKSALGDLWTGQPDAMTEDAEAALWQDLAKLIDVSTEDVLKASKAGDFATFEADDLDRPQTELDVEASKPPTVDQKPAPKPISRNQEPQLPLAKLTQTLAVQQREPAPELAATMSGVGSPSPVVYPLRPSKKLESLAAVDLPTFPRPK